LRISISFYLSSPEEKFIQQFAETLLKSPEVKLSRNLLIISNIEVFSKPDIQDDVTIRMLSPVTIYSTLFSANGKKKTYYYSLFEKEFSQLIRANRLKKYEALYGTPGGRYFMKEITKERIQKIEEDAREAVSIMEKGTKREIS